MTRRLILGVVVVAASLTAPNLTEASTPSTTTTTTTEPSTTAPSTQPSTSSSVVSTSTTSSPTTTVVGASTSLPVVSSTTPPTTLIGEPATGCRDRPQTAVNDCTGQPPQQPLPATGVNVWVIIGAAWLALSIGTALLVGAYLKRRDMR